MVDLRLARSLFMAVTIVGALASIAGIVGVGVGIAIGEGRPIPYSLLGLGAGLSALITGTFGLTFVHIAATGDAILAKLSDK